MQLLLFTQSYPYGEALEDTFIEPELPYLREVFERVTIVPGAARGAKAALPAGIELDDSLAGVLALTRADVIRRAATSRLVASELRAQPRLLANPRAVLRLVDYAARAEAVRRWGHERLHDAGRTLAYTFWCDHVTTGLCAASARAPELTVVSRAHGIDLYAERHDPPYLPCRELTLRGLAGLFPDSDRGTRYVASRYPWFERCDASLMGVLDPGFTTPASEAGAWSVVSCSRLIPIKRVDRILRGVAELARRRPELAVTWRHLGEGPLRDELLAIARTELPANARAELVGYPSRDAMLELYRTQPIDVFVNASSSEGTPVSIMEAISCGIPVVATAVGGNTEIVTSENGRLVSPDPSPAEIGEALGALADDRALATQLRTGSRALWERRYNADRNYRAFARRLRDLVT